MFQPPDPDYNVWIGLLKIVGLLIGVYIWGKLSTGWIKKK